jgi:hypothetical protein
VVPLWVAALPDPESVARGLQWSPVVSRLPVVSRVLPAGGRLPDPEAVARGLPWSSVSVWSPVPPTRVAALRDPGYATRGLPWSPVASL